MALPQGMQRPEHRVVLAVLDDLDPGVVGGHVDLVERVEAHAAVQVTRADQVHLDDIPLALRARRRVGDALRGAPPA